MRLLITDLDNTLYDWVTFFSRSFLGMVEELSILLGVDRESLFDEFKVLHQFCGNSEQPFTALNLPSVRRRFPGVSRQQLLQELDGPLHAFNRLRSQHLQLYDSVEETLEILSAAGVTIVGHTESTAENAFFRLQKLEIAHFFRRLYVLESDYEGHPDPARAALLSPPQGFIETVPRSERKPNPVLLQDICRREGTDPEDAWYVGDSLTRDMSMARMAGITSVWARYGTLYDRELWKVLVRITHWSSEDVAREEALKKQFENVQPDFVIDSFEEILSLPGLSAEWPPAVRAVQGL
jgi:phosphoglycolate phosphatase-like HAD superfamily hydrolase